MEVNDTVLGAVSATQGETSVEGTKEWVTGLKYT